MCLKSNVIRFFSCITSQILEGFPLWKVLDIVEQTSKAIKSSHSDTFHHHLTGFLLGNDNCDLC